MQPEIILQSDLLDIIFENRNKDYGAYALRREYNSRIKKGLLVVLIFVVALFVVNFWNNNFSSESQSATISRKDTGEVILEPIQPPEKQKPIDVPKQIATIKHPTFILTTEKVADTIPTIEELNTNVAIATETKPGDSTIEIISPPPIPLKETGTGTSNVQPKEENSILPRAEIMPEFPGGEAALHRFLSRNLRVPEDALQQGERIKILVQFVVDKEGSISGIKFIQSGGEIFEQEVFRVMKKMPKWRPGMQNGKNVAVYFVIPVVFEIVE